MKTIPISELQSDPITKALVDTKGKATPISGYIHSTSDGIIRFSTSRGSQSYMECPKADVLAAFKCDKKSEKIFLLVANNAQIRVISHFKANELNEKKYCECDNGTGVVEARPLDSIHPALAALAAEMRAIKGMMGTGPGALHLKCAAAHHDSIIKGGNVDEANFIRDLCLAGIDV